MLPGAPEHLGDNAAAGLLQPLSGFPWLSDKEERPKQLYPAGAAPVSPGEVSALHSMQCFSTTSPTAQWTSSSCRITFPSQSHSFPEELAEIVLISHIPVHLTSLGLPEPFFPLPAWILCGLSSTFVNPPSASSHGALKTQRKMKRHKAERCCHQTPLPNWRHCYLLPNFVYSCADTLPPTWQYFIQDKLEFTSRTFQRIPTHLFTNSVC